MQTNHPAHHGDMERPPVLILGYKRVAEIEKIVDVLSASNACCIIISMDGPQRTEVSSSNSRLKKLATKVSSTTNLVLRNLPHNLGIAEHLYHAVSRVLETHECVIVLEDDCIPATGFYSYMTQALRTHQGDMNVGTIAADAHVFRRRNRAYVESSIYPLTWGWATWADRWSRFDPQLSNFNEREINDAIRKAHASPFVRRHWSRRVKESISDRNMWDAQWTVYQWLNNYETLNPSIPLINNIGHDGNATHTLTQSIFTNVGFHPLSQHLWSVSDVRFPIKWNRMRTAEHFSLIRVDNLLGLLFERARATLTTWIKIRIRSTQEK